ncbi:MAG: tetratricopeptide repeat protein [Bacteroidetes bacterium]|nr:tetratricopeptide repeat protein [Bacteroidota bacterium]
MRNRSLIFGLLLMHIGIAGGLSAQPGTGPADAQQHLDAARNAYTAGRLDSALALVDHAIRIDPKLAKAYKLRGDVYQRSKEFEPALADYKTAENLDPSDARLYVSRSALRITDGNLKGALRDADKAVDLDPTDADAWYNRGCALYLSGNIEASLKDANKAIRLRPAFADAIYLRGVIKGEQYHEEEGVGDIEEALKLDPHIPGGLMSLAILLFEGERYEEAITKFTEVLAKDTTELAAAHYYRGDSYYHLQDKEHACIDWTESARLGDKDAVFIKKNYCETDATTIPKKPKKAPRKSTIQF